MIRDEKIYQETRYTTEAIADQAASFLRSPRDKPFFLYVGFNGPYGLDGDTLTLSFPQTSAFHRSALDGADLREAFQDALQSVLGRRLQIRTSERPDDLAEAEADAKRNERKRDVVRDRLSASEIEAARSSPLTKLAESQLGARIVHIERDA